MTKWLCEGCGGIVRFDDGEPMECFAQGVIAGLLLAHHRKRCQGHHYEEGHVGGPSLEEGILGAVAGKSWVDIEAGAKVPP
jgi:hypothetical protein